MRYVPTQKEYEQIMKIAEHNVTVYRALLMYRHGELEWGEMLIAAIGHLVVDNAALKSTLTQKIETSIQPVIINLKNP